MKGIRINLLFFSILFSFVTNNLFAVYLGHVDEEDNGKIHRRVFVDFSRTETTHAFEKQVFYPPRKENSRSTEEICMFLSDTVKRSMDSADPEISDVTINFINISKIEQWNKIDKIVNFLKSKKSSEPHLNDIVLSAFYDPQASGAVKNFVEIKDTDLTDQLM